jgi:hypothetical protein
MGAVSTDLHEVQPLHVQARVCREELAYRGARCPVLRAVCNPPPRLAAASPRLPGGAAPGRAGAGRRRPGRGRRRGGRAASGPVRRHGGWRAAGGAGNHGRQHRDQVVATRRHSWVGRGAAANGAPAAASCHTWDSAWGRPGGYSKWGWRWRRPGRPDGGSACAGACAGVCAHGLVRWKRARGSVTGCLSPGWPHAPSGGHVCDCMQAVPPRAGAPKSVRGSASAKPDASAQPDDFDCERARTLPRHHLPAAVYWDPLGHARPRVRPRKSPHDPETLSGPTLAPQC